MRLWLWAIGLCGACFSEVPSDKGCREGTPGCDCTSAGACDEGLECVVSIDKCVPVDCIPGSHTCVCTDAGTCDDPLLCTGGVCLRPEGETTGAATATSTAGSTSSTTGGASTDVSGPLSTAGESLTSSLTDGLDSSTTVVDPSLTGATSIDTASGECPMCLDTAAQGSCSLPFSQCVSDDAPGGCNDLQACVLGGDTIDACCAQHDAGDNGHQRWNAFVSCAQLASCGGACPAACL